MPGETVQSDSEDIARGLKMAAVAVMSAIITASVVIGVGEVWLSRTAAEGASNGASASDGPLIRTSG